MIVIQIRLFAEICQMSKDEGPCTGNNSRWYFDSQAEVCLEFLYSGCRGNRNNFLTQKECESVCQKYKGMCDKGVQIICPWEHANESLYVVTLSFIIL
jgi:hypothetical protein